MNNGTVAFDHGPREFPVATILPRDPKSHAAVWLGDLRRWLVARWSWLRPRTVPVAVAAIGMLLVLASADYLSRDHSSHAQNNRVMLHVTSTPHTIVFR